MQGADRNWTGSQFDQANWYAFGRLAWDPTRSAKAIAEDWVRMTFSNDPSFVEPVVAMMMGSREAVVDYMTPLGLAHQMASGTHYGPGPWVADNPEPDWNPVYYNRADSVGIGFDRTASGSNAVAQYAPPVAAQFSSLKTVPEEYLLWFHHVPWDHRLSSGRTLWDELVLHYSHGVDVVRAMRKTWSGLASYVDPERFAEIASLLPRTRSRSTRLSASRSVRATPASHPPARRRTPSFRDHAAAAARGGTPASRVSSPPFEGRARPGVSTCSGGR